MKSAINLVLLISKVQRLTCVKKNIIYLNYGSNKVKRFYENYENAVIEKFYTDSYNDKALMEISESDVKVNIFRARQRLKEKLSGLRTL